MAKLILRIAGQDITPTRNGKPLHNRNRLRVGDQLLMIEGIHVVSGFRGPGPLLVKASSQTSADDISAKAQAMRDAGVAC